MSAPTVARLVVATLVALPAVEACTGADHYVITGGVDADASADGATEEIAVNGCAAASATAGDSIRTVRVGTVSRTYVLHVPSVPSASRPAPLIVDFHAIGNSGTSELSNSPYPELTDLDGVVMAFPDGMKGPAGTGWNVGPCCVADVDDVAFARELVRDASTAVCIDADRVYAVGVSTGGGMAHYLACRAADIFAGAAPAAFDLLAENVDLCKPSRPITVVSFRGTADVKVPYEGGASALVPNMPVTFLGAVGTFQKWAALDGCGGAASAEDSDGCARYTDCRDGVEVVLCTQQGGRQAPGDARIAWPILQRHPR